MSCSGAAPTQSFPARRSPGRFLLEAAGAATHSGDMPLYTTARATVLRMMRSRKMLLNQLLVTTQRTRYCALSMVRLSQGRSCSITWHGVGGRESGKQSGPFNRNESGKVRRKSGLAVRHSDSSSVAVSTGPCTPLHCLHTAAVTCSQHPAFPGSQFSCAAGLSPARSHQTPQS